MPTAIQRNPYEIRWVSTLLYGIALGVVLLGFVGTVALAGGVSTTDWGSSIIIACVVAFGGTQAALKIHHHTKQLNFIEKNMMVMACSVVVMGAYYNIFQWIHGMRMQLTPDTMRLMQQLTPAYEKSLFIGALWASGISFGISVLLMSTEVVMARVRPNSSRRTLSNTLTAFLLLAVAILTFEAGRSATFIMRAVA